MHYDYYQKKRNQNLLLLFRYWTLFWKDFFCSKEFNKYFSKQKKMFSCIFYDYLCYSNRNCEYNFEDNKYATMALISMLLNWIPWDISNLEWLNNNARKKYPPSTKHIHGMKTVWKRRGNGEIINGKYKMHKE